MEQFINPKNGGPESIRAWYVTAPHRTQGIEPELPYGVAHLRQVGGTYTACKRPALNWPVFWDTEWDDLTNQCPDCRSAVPSDQDVRTDGETGT